MITFTVPGIPRPGGSKRAFVNRHTGRVALTETGVHTPAWRSDVKDAAAKAMGRMPPLDGPLWLHVAFVFPRPKKHYRTGKRSNEMKEDAPQFHISAPDTTKLLRSLEDALKGIVWVDDSRVAKQHATKSYGDNPGAHVTIGVLDEEQDHAA